MRSGPGAARTILLFHIISASPSKQPLMVGRILGVYIVGLIFVSARTNKRHHNHHPLPVPLPLLPPFSWPFFVVCVVLALFSFLCASGSSGPFPSLACRSPLRPALVALARMLAAWHADNCPLNCLCLYHCSLRLRRHPVQSLHPRWGYRCHVFARCPRPRGKSPASSG